MADGGAVAPADGNAARGREAGVTEIMGANFERLEELRPDLVNALRELVRGYRQEGAVARRHEIRRIRQARLFWQGQQYSWWNPADMKWQVPYEQRSGDGRDLEEMPRYQFVTNFYQGFGLSFVALLSQDVPSVRFYPQAAQALEDIAAARAASDVAQLIEQNNHVEQLLTLVGYHLWNDGKLGGYVRYVADGQRFGFREEEVLEAVEIPLGEDSFVCPPCGKEGPLTVSAPSSPVILSDSEGSQLAQEHGASGVADDDEILRSPAGAGNLRMTAPSLAAPAHCPGCGAELGEADIHRAERVTVPRVAGMRRTANGQEVISIVGGLELNTPAWANEMHEFPYLQWQAEVHRAKLKAAYPHAAEQIESSPAQGAEDVYARTSRLSVAQGFPGLQPGDALVNLITFDRTWIRPWAFYAVEDEAVRAELLQLFPDGCYVAFAGDAYCEARSETMDDHWRVLHAFPGDGQGRPSVGDSLVQVQERYNVLSNIQAETYEYGIPPIYADPQVLDFDALANQVAEPSAHFPARARPGQPLAAGFFQPAPAQVPRDMLLHQQDLIGPVAQFLTGLFPAVFGGNMEDVKTASGYALARDQAMGRLGLVWRRTKQFYAEMMLLGVDCFRKNRPEDAEIPLLGPDGVFDSRAIRLAELKGNISVHPEADETFPRMKSQQRGVLQQLFALKDPLVQRALEEPANIGYIKNVLGLSELVIPGEDARNKQLREIQQLLAGAPIVVGAPEQGRNANYEMRNSGMGDAAGVDAVAGGASPAPTAGSGAGVFHESPVTSHASLLLPSVAVDELLDDHASEFEECKRWASSEAGQAAKMTNPAGFANVRAHAEAHLRAMAPAASEPSSASLIHESHAAPNPRLKPPRNVSVHAETDGESAGDHWVTIDGNHVLIHEPQEAQNQNQADTQPEEGQRGHELMDSRQVAVHSYTLFQASGFGNNSTEHSMWVISKDGQYEFIVWPWSAEAGKESWKGPAPKGAVAIIHTHPSAKSERPSSNDHDLADGKQSSSIRMPVYVLHRNGIWKAVPGVKDPIRVRDSRWVNDFKP